MKWFLILLLISVATIISCNKRSLSDNIVRNFIFTDSCDEASTYDPSVGAIVNYSSCGPVFLPAQITFLSDTNRIIFLSDTFKRAPGYNFYLKLVAPGADRFISFKADSIFYSVGKGGGVFSPISTRYRGKEKP